MAAAFLGATLDLLSTWIGIAVFGFYETRPLGFNPLIEYPVMLGVTFLIYKLAVYLSRASNSQRILKLGSFLALAFVLNTYYASIHNILVIVGLI